MSDVPIYDDFRRCENFQQIGGGGLFIGGSDRHFMMGHLRGGSVHKSCFDCGIPTAGEWDGDILVFQCANGHVQREGWSSSTIVYGSEPTMTLEEYWNKHKQTTEPEPSTNHTLLLEGSDSKR